MPHIVFTKNLERHIACPAQTVPGNTVGEVLAAAFAHNPGLRGYILDDQGQLRKHILVAVDGQIIVDRITLRDPVAENAEVYVLQALSGG